jgi:hypothetical protein
MISDVVGFSGGGGGRATGAYPVAAVRHCEHGRGGGGGEAEREEEREEPARGVRGEEGGRARHKRARSRGAAVRRWMELTGWRPAAWRKVRVVRMRGSWSALGFAGFWVRSGCLWSSWCRNGLGTAVSRPASRSELQLHQNT